MLGIIKNLLIKLVTRIDINQDDLNKKINIELDEVQDMSDRFALCREGCDG